MDILEDYANELDDLIKSIDTHIKNKARPEFIKSRIVRSKQIIQSFKLELHDHDIKDPKIKSYRNQIQQSLEKLNQYIIHVEYLETNELKGNGKQELTTDNALQMGLTIQKTDKSILDDIIINIEQTRDIATQTNLHLHMQTQQLEKNQQELHVMETRLSQSNKLLKSFLRRAATDKLIIGFIVLIAAGVVFIVIWQLVN